MILLAYATPLWFRLIDPIVISHYGGDVTKANILPRKRSALLARWDASDVAARVTHTAGRAGSATPPDAGAHQCPDCGYVYRVNDGHAREGFAPGTPWSKVPDDWHCPDCGVRDKVDFVPVEPAGAR